MIPELALEARARHRVPAHAAMAGSRSPGYRSPFPPQVNWLDRNLPFHTNFMRSRAANSIRFLSDVARSIRTSTIRTRAALENKRARDACIAFLERKLGDPALVRR